MFKDEILENERRRKIFKVIETNLGIHLRELQRVLNIPLATLEYHLGYMTRKISIAKQSGTVKGITQNRLTLKIEKFYLS